MSQSSHGTSERGHEITVRVENVAKSYGSPRSEVSALSGVSIEVRRGERVALLGKSGSGKSTLLNLIGGLDRPSSGRIEAGGRDLAVAGDPRRRARAKCRRKDRVPQGRAGHRMTMKPERRPATRATDILGLSFSALRQQKVRTILTVTGVVIGTFALVLSLAIGRGVDHAIVSLFHEDSRLRKITVNKNYETTAEEVPASEREPKGVMSDAKRKRIRKALVRTWGQNHLRKEQKLLDLDAIESLRSHRACRTDRTVCLAGWHRIAGREDRRCHRRLNFHRRDISEIEAPRRAAV